MIKVLKCENLPLFLFFQRNKFNLFLGQTKTFVMMRSSHIVMGVFLCFLMFFRPNDQLINLENNLQINQ